MGNQAKAAASLSETAQSPDLRLMARMTFRVAPLSVRGHPGGQGELAPSARPVESGADVGQAPDVGLWRQGVFIRRNEGLASQELFGVLGAGKQILASAVRHETPSRWPDMLSAGH